MLPADEFPQFLHHSEMILLWKYDIPFSFSNFQDCILTKWELRITIKYTSWVLFPTLKEIIVVLLLNIFLQ